MSQTWSGVFEAWSRVVMSRVRHSHIGTAVSLPTCMLKAVFREGCRVQG